MNRFRLIHLTEFQYDGPVSESYNEVHLQPTDDEWQNCVAFRLRTQPQTAASASRDYFGNWVHRFNIMPKHRRLRVEAESVVMVQQIPVATSGGPMLGDLDDLRASLMDDHYDFMTPSVYAPTPPALAPLVQLAEQQSDGSAVGFAHAAATLVHQRFQYTKGSTHVHSSVADVLEAGTGVCQDFAHILIAMARHRGLPARYVSGYLVPPRDGTGASVEEVIGGQASHAWAELFVPSVGWLGLDPTLGQAVDHQHIRIAYGRDYGDVAPVRGVYKGHAGQRLSVDVRVRPALDDDGCEQLRESSAATPEPPPEELPQQQQQQQQQ
ncbi:MAG TPA: transglutaminase family protein [Candidatus Binatia bacterium]|jgi:transglutaminase-like putative cysteine protease|nr:transglutaminase family protein [Candidatus Binatia bacterium]